MEKTIERIGGDTEGVAYEFPVYRFAGSDPAAPRTYIQAALHAGELPGTVAIHALMPLLRQAEAEGRIRGDLTIVPWANPVGRAQYHFGSIQGRFHLGTRENFNRAFPLLERPDARLPEPAGPLTPDKALKRRLVELSAGHRIVLDLHCDDEGVLYLYVPKALWPGMADCAAAFDAEAVILWEGDSGAAFEEAAIHPHLQDGVDPAGLQGRVVTTVELRGLPDVYPELAEQDARRLYRLLVGRGVVADTSLPAPPAYAGVVAEIDHVEMISAPRGGAVLFDVAPGEWVEAGQRLARIVFAPGEEDGDIAIAAPQKGFVFTRTTRRIVRAGEDILKIAGQALSEKARSGALED